MAYQLSLIARNPRRKLYLLARGRTEWQELGMRSPLVAIFRRHLGPTCFSWAREFGVKGDFVSALFSNGIMERTRKLENRR